MSFNLMVAIAGIAAIGLMSGLSKKFRTIVHETLLHPLSTSRFQIIEGKVYVQRERLRLPRRRRPKQLELSASR